MMSKGRRVGAEQGKEGGKEDWKEGRQGRANVGRDANGAGRGREGVRTQGTAAAEAREFPHA